MLRQAKWVKLMVQDQIHYHIQYIPYQVTASLRLLVFDV